MKIFGFEIKKDGPVENIPSFTARESDDGALIVSAGSGYGTYLDLDGSAKTEAEIVAKYREMSIQPEIDIAISDIMNEAIVKENNDDIVDISLDRVPFSDDIKERITEEFKKVVELLDFNRFGYEIFKRWYVDGRLYYHCMIDVDDPRSGIKELRYIDPRKIRKIRAMKRVRKDGAYMSVTDSEFYMYNDKGFKGASTTGMDNQGLQIAKDSILHITSGLVDRDNKLVLGWLHKAIKPLNQLRILEDSTIIYRLSRAPERRVFNVDVGNLPKMKAEQYLREVMVNYKNRVIYDSSTGNLKDDRKFMTMWEDFWFPRRSDGSGTKIETLPGGQNLGEMGDVEYFEKKLYQALNIPIARMLPDSTFSLGRSGEITRDELKFQKFIVRLRLKFSDIFLKALEKQLLLTGVLTTDDWQQIENKIDFVFQADNYFAELKKADILASRMNTLGMVDPFVGKYYSEEWVKKNILEMDDEEIAEMQKQISTEFEYNLEQQKVQMQAQAEMQPQDNQDEQGQDSNEPSPDEPQLTNNK